MRGWEGRVVLRVSVRADGGVAAIEVARSAGRAALDRAAQDVVATWRFTPARRMGAAAAAVVLVPIQFRLE